MRCLYVSLEFADPVFSGNGYVLLYLLAVFMIQDLICRAKLISTYSRALVRELVRAGHEVFVVCGSTSDGVSVSSIPLQHGVHGREPHLGFRKRPDSMKCSTRPSCFCSFSCCVPSSLPRDQMAPRGYTICLGRIRLLRHGSTG